MGFFDLFTGGSGGGGALKKHAARVANKRAQAPDRWESIQALAQIGTPEAIDALLMRFSYLSDPSITDQEEKDAAYEAVIEARDRHAEHLLHRGHGRAARRRGRGRMCL